MRLLEKLKIFMQSCGTQRGEVLLLCDDLGKLASFWCRRILMKNGTADVLTHFAYASRQYNISTLYLSQDLTQLSMGYRKNFDFVMFRGLHSGPAADVHRVAVQQRELEGLRHV